MKWLRFFALALVLMTSMGLFGMAQIGIQVSASATQVCGTLYSHDLNVSWKVSGATARPNIAIVVTLVGSLSILRNRLEMESAVIRSIKGGQAPV
jgi:hypothetical protein